jgi:response regulator RpfG family c-di-GMP phosphodiesterase
MADAQASANAERDVALSDNPGPFSLLLVDDEPNVLNALLRALHGSGYRLHSATSGAEGIAILAREPIDLVISDMRMPEMTGAEFLATVRIAWPETVRVLLTGHADVPSMSEAINQGEIFRYISKPWDEAQLIAIVELALERKALEREKRRLELLTQKQNIELAELNHTLEHKVEQRTGELRQSHVQLRSGFLDTVRVFSSIVEMRDGSMAGHSRRVAEHVRRIARRLEVSPDAAQNMLFAALLHDIGKIGLPDRILACPLTKLSIEDRMEYQKHPAKGAALFMSMKLLAPVARIIHMHHERMDGSGFPDNLEGQAIWLGARILAVADDYDEMIHGNMLERPCSAAQASEHILLGRGRIYDSEVVDAFFALHESADGDLSSCERKLRSQELEPGMALARDLLSSEGVPIVFRDQMLDSQIIREISAYERCEGKYLTIVVKD